ncbi:MAG: phage portal protein [Ruminiclostridium sp.]|nr:phage portal protein [Ruminiclostridium sp.]
MFTIPENTKITPKLAVRFILKHSLGNDRLDSLYRYYIGEHDILSRPKDKNAANNRLVCNHAKYITDCTTGYFLGTPVKYVSSEGKDISAITEVLRRCDSDTQDIDLARFGSIFGVSYEMIYMTADSTIKLASLDPRSAFVVYDDTVEQKPVFGVYYMPIYGEDGFTSGYRVYLCDSENVTEFFTTPTFAITSVGEPYRHFFGGVPITEYYNNWDKQGDYEQVTTLIDAYNTLQSDRVNDKEQFVDSLLVIKGQVLGDTADEQQETFGAIKKYGVMTIDDTGDAKWLTRQFDENSVDVLRRSIESDIHKFSGVPCMSDSSFSGNSSGVAMKYKLIGFEQMTKIKERYFTEGLKIRLGLIANALTALGAPKPDVGDIRIVFTHSLPENEAEIAKTISLLKDVLPNEKLIKLLPGDMANG